MAQLKKPKYGTVDELKWNDKHWNDPRRINLDIDAWRKTYKDSGIVWGWSRGCHLDHVTDRPSASATDEEKQEAELKRVTAFVALAEWAQCMFEWGRDVRLHIENLKAEAGLEGDPGDPPPPPWGK